MRSDTFQGKDEVESRRACRVGKAQSNVNGGAMYFWNIEGLLDDIASQKITEQQKFYYYLLLGCGALVVMTLVRTFPASPDELRVGPAAADLILSLIITIWGTKRCFAINQSGSGGDFIARMTCLTLPVSIRWTVVVIPYLFITAFFLEFIERVFEEGSLQQILSLYAEMALFQILYLGYFLYLIGKFRALAAKTAAS